MSQTIRSMQIVQLTASGNFEEALVLCKFLPPEDSGLRASKEQSIHIRYILIVGTFERVIIMLLQFYLKGHTLIFRANLSVSTYKLYEFIVTNLYYFKREANKFMNFRIARSYNPF